MVPSLSNTTDEKDYLQRYKDCAFINTITKEYNSKCSKLSEDYDRIFEQNMKKKKELEENKALRESLMEKIEDLEKNNQNLTSCSREQNEKNKYLEAQKNQMEKSLYDARNEIELLKCQNQMIASSDKKSKERINKLELLLSERNDEIREEKTKCRNLNTKLRKLHDELKQNADKSRIETQKLSTNVKFLKAELENKMRTNSELINKLLVQKNDFEELQKALDRSRQNVEKLNSDLEQVKIKEDRLIDKLRKEKSEIERKQKEVEMIVDDKVNELKKYEFHNEQLKKDIEEVQYKLDFVTKNADEERILANEKTEKIYNEMKNLEVDLTLKNSQVLGLEDKLTEARRMQKAESDNVFELRNKLENLKRKKNLVYNPQPGGEVNEYVKVNAHFNKVLDELQRDYTNIKVKKNTTLFDNYAEKLSSIFR